VAQILRYSSLGRRLVSRRGRGGRSVQRYTLGTKTAVAGAGRRGDCDPVLQRTNLHRQRIVGGYEIEDFLGVAIRARPYWQDCAQYDRNKRGINENPVVRMNVHMRLAGFCLPWPSQGPDSYLTSSRLNAFVNR
jgi:hypothetical protein